MDIQESKSCDNCQNRWICVIRHKFEESLFEARVCLERGLYPSLCQEFYRILAPKCKRYDPPIVEEDDDGS